MRRAGGFGLLGYLIAAGAVLAALWGFVLWVDAHWETAAGVKKGAAAKQAEWDAANREAEAAEKERRGRLEAAARDEERKRRAADARARDYEQRWKEARDAAQRSGKELAVCQQGTGAGAGAGGAVLFTWDFLRLWDGVWHRAGDPGQPLFGDPASAAPGGPGAASPYGPGDALDNHAENARRQQACARDLNALIDQVERLRAEWGAQPLGR